MNMFEMGTVAGVSTAQPVTKIDAGIHQVKFTGITKAEGLVEAVDFNFELIANGAIFRARLFEPKSATRPTLQFGEVPSDIEQFMCKIKQFIAALNPELSTKIEDGSEKLSASSFDQFVAILVKLMTPHINTITNIKLIPNNKGYMGIPTNVVSVSQKTNSLYTRTKFIGEDLVLTKAEVDIIAKFESAAPTSMNKSVKDDLSDLDNLGMGTPVNQDNITDLNDLPF